MEVSFWYSNLNSMVNKLDEFKVNIKNTDPTIILITETWLNSGMPDSLVDIPGYTLYRNDRATHGGGVCVYVKSLVAGYRVFSGVSQLFSTAGSIESIWLEVDINKVRLLVACVYRPKRATTVEQNLEFIHTLERAMALSEPVYVIGDFNYPEINWQTLTVLPSDQSSLDFLNSYKSHRGRQMITFPTRIRNGQISLLDLFFVNDKHLIFDIQNEAPLGLSDHVVITAKTQLQFPTKPTHKIYKRQFWSADYESVNDYLLQQNFEPRDKSETSCERLLEILMNAIDRYVPLIPKKVNPNKPWLNKAAFKEIQKKRNLWHRYENNRTVEGYLLYRAQSNKTKSFIEQARRTYEQSLLSSSDKHFFAYIRRVLGSKLVNFSLLDKTTNAQVQNDEEIAECFAQQFQSVFVREEATVTGCTLPNSTYLMMEKTDIIFTPEKIEDAIKSLKLDSSPGPDHIPTVFIKRCAGSLSGPLSSVMNNILETGSFPDIWKKAVVVPIYKGGNRQLPENYRPISLTSTLCKCMEKVIVRELTPFFLDTHVIPPEQHGFLPKRSTVTNLLVKLHSWTQADDSRQPTDVVYLDFERAFDKIPISSLLYKLEHYGIRGKLLQLVGGFLQRRVFSVRVGSAISKEYSVYSGVPQGSVLGPLLFVVYMSDLCADLKTNYSSFADDTNIYCNPMLQSVQLQEDLNAVKTWSETWNMPLNDAKCTVLHIGNNNTKQAYFFHQFQIKEVQCHKDLGVLVTNDLKWEQHITQITKKAFALIHLIRKAFQDHSSQMILRLYKTYVRPKVEYAHIIWSPYYVKDIEQLERVQRRITKIPVELRHLPYENRLSILNLTTLYQRRIRGDLIETYKIISGYYGCDLDIFHLNQTTNLRGHSRKLFKERCNKLLRRNFITNRVVYCWNKLEEDTVNSQSVNQFKNRLDREMENWDSFFIHYL